MHSHLHKIIDTPEHIPFQEFQDAATAILELERIYQRNIKYLRQKFTDYCKGTLDTKIRAYYPAIRITVQSHEQVDSRFAYGYVSEPGTYQATITQPELFKNYLTEQLSLLIKNHHVGIEVGESSTPIPLHFAFPAGMHVEGAWTEMPSIPLRDVFDVPDLAITDDSIVNGTWNPNSKQPKPLSPFTAQRIDYSLQRLKHYTGTDPEYFQNYVLFTNYQFYVDEFCEYAKQAITDSSNAYTAFISPGNVVTKPGQIAQVGLHKPVQMPAYHLYAPDNSGITLINIGVGPSNAKTITDHVAVLRPHAWIMLGHCAGLRASQNLGDYVLAHGYVRDDHVLDADLPLWVPLPPLAEIQVALERAVADVTGLDGWELKKLMRTGTVASMDDRNWELRNYDQLIERFSQSRAIGLDMESATIAANGFRLRVPYGTLLCISDKPLHGELKLPGMATEFYRTQVNQHLKVGIQALEHVRKMPKERLHSRKLRGFLETAFQ